MNFKRKAKHKHINLMKECYTKVHFDSFVAVQFLLRAPFFSSIHPSIYLSLAFDASEPFPFTLLQHTTNRIQHMRICFKCTFFLLFSFLPNEPYRPCIRLLQYSHSIFNRICFNLLTLYDIAFSI